MPDKSIRGQFLWHELMTSDTTAAAAFYKKVAGWEASDSSGDPSYLMLTYKGIPMAGLMKVPAEARAMGAGPSWLSYVGTPDIHVTSWDAQRFGGKVHKAPKSMPNVGTWAVLQDPQGAAFGTFTPEKTPKVPAEPGVGDFSWHELATTDHKAAFNFYRDLFGWEKTDTMDMGAAGEYLMYGWGKNMLGGMYTKGKEMPGPAAWLAYIRVPDVKAATKTLQAAGGRVLTGPMEVPGGDWITMAVDPQGAAFAIHAKAAKAAKRPTAKKASKPARKPVRKAAGKGKTKAAKPKGSKKAKRVKAKRKK